MTTEYIKQLNMIKYSIYSLVLFGRLRLRHIEWEGEFHFIY